jgi:hypothetical protein
MSGFLSIAAYSAQKALESQGIGIKRARIFEIFAAMFGYHTYKDASNDIEEIEHQVSQSALIVLQSHQGISRTADILQKEMLSHELVPVAFQTARTCLVQVLPPTTFNDHFHFIDTYVAQVVRRYLFEGEDSQVIDAQLKVSARCDVFVTDVPEFPDLLDVRGPVWAGEYMGMIYPSGPDGKAIVGEDYIIVNAYVQFDKVGRAMLSPDVSITCAATAARYNAGMGGIAL